MHTSCTWLFSVLFIVGYWAVHNSFTTKHYCCVSVNRSWILILDSSAHWVNVFLLLLLLLWCGRAIQVGRGRVRQVMCGGVSGKRPRLERSVGKEAQRDSGGKGGGEKTFTQRGARAPRPNCAHSARAPIPQAPEPCARADMKRPCEDTTSDSDMDETIDVGSENNYPA